MNAEDIKNKATETMSTAKEKVEAIASDKRVQSAKVSILKLISNAKFWIVSNWNTSGWHGKAKVAAAIIVAFFFCRGVFCGWGASQNATSTPGSSSSEEDAAIDAFCSLLGAVREQNAQQDTISIWTCRNCGRQIQSKSIPAGSIRCPSGTQKYCFFNKSN